MKFILFLTLILMLWMPVKASDIPPLDYLGIESGLSNNAVTSIYQDKYGFMWFGTYEGLNRYDGYNFKVFRNRIGDSTSLNNNWVVVILEDFKKDIWVGTKQGASVYSTITGKFSPVNYKSLSASKSVKLTSVVNDLALDPNGNMLVATGGAGMIVYNKEEGNGRQIPFKSEAGASSNYHVQAIEVDKNKQVWIFIQGEGLAIFDYEKQEIKLVSNAVTDAKCLLADNDGNIWIGNENALYKYTIKSKYIRSFREGRGSISNGNIHGLDLDSKGNIWVSTDGGGVNILNNQTDEIQYIFSTQEKGSLKSSAVNAVYEDKEKRIWIGTLRGGVNILDTHKNRFKTVSHVPFNKNSLINDFILSFCEDDSGIWVGTDGSGISYWNRKKNIFTNYSHSSGDPNSLTNNNVSRIVKDYKGNVWIATYGGGINKFNPATKSFSSYSCYNSAFKYADRNVWSLFEDSKKNLWAGTCSNGGLYKLNKSKDRFDLFDENLKDVITITEDKQGRLWAGTFSQLIQIDQKYKKHRIIEIGHSVRAIYEDTQSRFWLGTEGGGLSLLNRETGKLISYSEKDGLPSNSILNILEDKSGNLWLSTFNGLSVFSPKTKKFKNFYESDGLQSNQFNFNAALKLSTGEFFFGGIKGFNVFYPEEIKPYNTVPKLLVTGLRINNVPYESDEALMNKTSIYALNALTLPYDKAVISVDFAALNYSGSNKISYAYFMDGWDNDWNYSGQLRIANYSRLREGTYHLRIKSTDSEGAWVPNERVIKFTILPPWWRSWWAYSFYTVMGIIALYIYTIYQGRQERLKYQIELANLKIEQEKELNEKKLSFFTHVSHEFRTPLTLIISPIEEFLNSRDSQVDTKELIVVYRNARRLLSLVDQLLHFRKSDIEDLKITRFNLVSFCKEVYLCFIQQAKLKELVFVFNCDKDDIEVYADKEKIEIALFNLISNAFKYTPAGGSIQFSINEHSTLVQLNVKDTGVGIAEEEEDRVFSKFYQPINKGGNRAGFGIGLYLVKKFIEAHSGNVSYSSVLEKGTNFKIELLKGRSHFDSNLVFESVGETPVFLDEMVEEFVPIVQQSYRDSDIELFSEKTSMLIVDDNDEIRNYVKRIFQSSYMIYEANSAEQGYKLITKHIPDIVITDVVMGAMSGVELCLKVKDDPALSHIPVILLTSSSSAEIKLKGIEGGADDYITKPFDKDILIARVSNLLKTRNNLQRFFYNQITFKSHDLKVAPEFKDFLEKCIAITERHLDNGDFNIQILAAEVGMSHSALYKRVKAISGRSINEFIRFIRLRKAAGLFINTNCNVNECALQSGFNDIKYFRVQFSKLFGMKPSEYIKKYRKPFNKSYKLNDKVLKG